MALMSTIVSAIPLIGNLIDKILPNKEEADKAKAKLVEMQQKVN